jgi:predicted ATPase/DNA-binding SARP family transcriptional activator
VTETECCTKSAPLAIRLLGPFEVRVGGAPLPPLRSRKGQWLMALLVLRHGREVRRDWLAEALWPDSLGDEALASLRQSLSDLRRALGPEAKRLQSPTPRTLRLDLEGAEVDVLAFDAAAAGDEAEALAHAVALYRGALLEGCAELWVLAEREAREQAYLQALESLAAKATASGDHEAAVRYLRLGAAVDPLRQRLHRSLMQTLAASGQLPAAVEVYRSLRRQLDRERLEEPDAETTALYHRIRDRARRRRGRGSESRKAEDDTVPTARSPFRRSPLALRTPRPLTALVGRERELREVSHRLLTARLITLTGPGGMGKTRLAIEVLRESAEEFEDGVCFVDLAPAAEPARVIPAVAAAIGLPDADRSGSPADPAALTDFMRSRQLLLVLDNCEHLIETCANLARALLSSCLSLRILATSRERLGLTGEVVYPVPPLRVPGPDAPADPETLDRCAATRLFLERAAEVRAGFVATAENATAVARICRRLDGIPLAIELAGALADVLTPEEIAARLDDRFRLLTSGDHTRPDRHQTLQAMIDGSHDRLDEAERVLFRRLAVFAGGWTLDAAEGVCGDTDGSRGRGPLLPSEILSLLARLVARSLVLAEAHGGATRYRMLETIRAYAADRLREAGEEEALSTRHLDHCLHLAEQAEPELTGPEQTAWLARLDAERDNLRAALAWGVSRMTDAQRLTPNDQRPTPALRLAGALGRYWQVRGLFREGREQLEWALAAGDGEDRTRQAAGGGGLDGYRISEERAAGLSPADCAARAKALSWSGFLALYQGDHPAARVQCERSLALWRRLGDTKGIAGALGCLGIVTKDVGDSASAETLFHESLSLWRERQDPVGIAGTLGYLGILAANRGDFAAARGFYEESLARRRQSEDRWGIAASLNNLGMLALYEHDYAAARALLEESLAIRRQLQDRRCTAITLNLLGLTVCALGDLPGARAHLVESLALAREIGERRSIAYGLEAFARLAAAELERRDPENGARRRSARRGARLGGAAEALRESIGAPLPAADRAAYTPALEAARNELGEAGFAAAWGEGRGMTMDDATEYANR